MQTALEMELVNCGHTGTEQGLSTEPQSQAAGFPEDASHTEGREYDPQTFCREMARLDELNKQLGEVQQQLNQASVRSLVLNADVVTQFDPHQEARLRQVMEECEACMARVRQRETQGGELASSTANYR